MFLLESRCSRHLDMIVWHFCLVLGWAIRVCVCMCVCAKYTQMRQRQCYSASRPCVICVLVGASQAREHSDLGPFGHGPHNTYICIYIYIHIYVNLSDCVYAMLSRRRCLFLIHEHLPERVIEREKEMENSCGALRGATRTM